MRPVVKLAALVASLSLLWAVGASAATLLPIGNFDQPIFVTSDPGDPDQLLVVEREGRVLRVEHDGVSLFGDLGSLVSCCESERGLLSIAPAPDFSSTGRFYAAYTGKASAGGAEGDLHVDSFRPSAVGGGQLLRDPIISVGHAEFANHNGGQLQVGPDGYLYISTGDGGGGGDPLGSGQELETLLGKVLRIDPRPGAVPPYAIPAANPFVGQAGLDEIWSYGLRNPWRFSFDRGGGDMIVADVGQGAREEIDLAPSPFVAAVGGAGANYGWNCREGFIAYAGAPESCGEVGGFTDPVFDYPHADPGGGKAHGCSITGGYVVRDASLGDLYGRYVYADFCTGEIRSVELPGAIGGPATGDRAEGLSVPSPTSFGEDSCGRLYVASNGGVVYRFSGAAPSDCPESVSPTGGGTPGSLLPPAFASTRQSKRANVHLRAAHRDASIGVAVVTVQVSPCDEYRWGQVQLNRGGRRFAAKHLNGRCIARFKLPILRRSTFRAILPPVGDAGSVRSRRLVIDAAGTV